MKQVNDIGIGSKFRHCFDVGIFIFITNNEDGTGLFEKKRDIGNQTERKYVTYNLNEMRLL